MKIEDNSPDSFTDDGYSGIISYVNPPTPKEIRKAREKTVLVSPEVFESTCCQFRVPNRVLDILVA